LIPQGFAFVSCSPHPSIHLLLFSSSHSLAPRMKILARLCSNWMLLPRPSLCILARRTRTRSRRASPVSPPRLLRRSSKKPQGRKRPLGTSSRASNVVLRAKVALFSSCSAVSSFVDVFIQGRRLRNEFFPRLVETVSANKEKTSDYQRITLFPCLLKLFPGVGCHQVAPQLTLLVAPCKVT